MSLTSSTVLTDFDFGSVGNRRGPQKHNWDELLDGSIRKIEASAFGEKGVPKSFASQASQVAKKRGKNLRIKKLPSGDIVLQAYVPEVVTTPSNDGTGPRVGPDSQVAEGAPETKSQTPPETSENHANGEQGKHAGRRGRRAETAA